MGVSRFGLIMFAGLKKWVGGLLVVVGFLRRWRKIMIDFSDFNKRVEGIIDEYEEDFAARPRASMLSLARISFINGYDARQEECEADLKLLVERLKKRVLSEVSSASEAFTYREALVMVYLLIEEVFNQ